MMWSQVRDTNSIEFLESGWSGYVQVIGFSRIWSGRGVRRMEDEKKKKKNKKKKNKQQAKAAEEAAAGGGETAPADQNHLSNGKDGHTDQVSQAADVRDVVQDGDLDLSRHRPNDSECVRKNVSFLFF